MAKSGTSKLKVLPQIIVAERVMAHHERGGFSQGEIRRNYLSGNMGDGFHIGRVREGVARKGEYGGTGPSEATRIAQLRPIAGRASLPPITDDDVMTYGERGDGLFVTRDNRVVRTTHMGDKPLPRLRNGRKPAREVRIVEDDARIAAVAQHLGVPLTAQNRQHILDYIARKDAGIVRG